MTGTEAGLQWEASQISRPAGVPYLRVRFGEVAVAYVEFGTNTIVVPRGFGGLDEETRRGVFAHEVAHLVLHRPTGLRCKRWRVTGQFAFAAVVGSVGISLDSGVGARHGWLVLALVAALFILLALEGARAARKTRKRETEADAWAAHRVGVEAAVKAISWSAPATKGRRGPLGGVLATHPGRESRVAAVRATGVAGDRRR